MSSDFLLSCPVELNLEVFSYLPTQDLCNLRFTSKRNADVVKPILFKAVVVDPQHPNVQHIVPLLCHTKKLTVGHWNSFPTRGAAIQPIDETRRCLRIIRPHLTNLESLTILKGHRATRHRRLSKYKNRNTNDYVLEAFVESLLADGHKIKTFNVDSFDSTRYQTAFNLFFEHLTDLRLGFGKGWLEDVPQHLCAYLASSSPNLTRLSISLNKMVCSEQPERNPFLRLLWSPKSPASTAHSELTIFPHLTSFSIEYSGWLNVALLKQFLEPQPALRSLDIIFQNANLAPYDWTGLEAVVPLGVRTWSLVLFGAWRRALQGHRERLGEEWPLMEEAIEEGRMERRFFRPVQ